MTRLIAGANLYDLYSGCGPYGRHNREYSRHELALLLNSAGFDFEDALTADVHVNRAANYSDIPPGLLTGIRLHDLGQYIFIRAVAVRQPRTKRPGWLYRTYRPANSSKPPGSAPPRRVELTLAAARGESGCKSC